MTAIGDEVRRRLDARFQSLEIGAYVQNVVPFLPLTADGVARVVELRLRHLSREWRQTGRWRGLSWSDTVLRVLAAKPYIQYVYASTDKLAARFAKYGAREVHTKADGPLKLLKRRLRESVIGNIHNSVRFASCFTPCILCIAVYLRCGSRALLADIHRRAAVDRRHSGQPGDGDVAVHGGADVGWGEAV